MAAEEGPFQVTEVLGTSAFRPGFRPAGAGGAAGGVGSLPGGELGVGGLGTLFAEF